MPRPRGQRSGVPALVVERNCAERAESVTNGIDRDPRETSARQCRSDRGGASETAVAEPVSENYHRITGGGLRP